MANPIIYMSVGQTLQLTASVLDQNSNNMSGRSPVWASSQPSKATVSATGLVTAVAAGTTNITATDGAAVETQPITVAALIPTTMKISGSAIKG